VDVHLKERGREMSVEILLEAHVFRKNCLEKTIGFSSVEKICM